MPKSELFSGGKAEEIYTELLDQHLTQKIADRGGIGLAEILRKQLGRELSTSGTDKGKIEE